MNCTEIEAELVGYHFGETSPDTRANLEAHLLACRACLQDYLLLKRAIETEPLDEAPTPMARMRLRKAVAAEVQKPRMRPWAWWERPTAFLVASAAMVAVLTMLHGISTGPGAMPHSLEVATRVAP